MLGEALLTGLAVAGRTCVGLVFLLAAAGQFRHWKILPGVIANYRLLPRWAVLPAARLLPPLELALSLLLLSGMAQKEAALAAMALLALFAVAMAINLRRGREHIDCGCGHSFLKQTLRWSLVARNGLLAALLSPLLGAPAVPSFTLLAMGACAGMAFALLYGFANTMAALPRPA